MTTQTLGNRGALCAAVAKRDTLSRFAAAVLLSTHSMFSQRTGRIARQLGNYFPEIPGSSDTQFPPARLAAIGTFLLLSITCCTAFLDRNIRPPERMTDGFSFSQQPSRSGVIAPTRCREREVYAIGRNRADEPIFTMGVLADIQYAPIPDGHSYSGSPRYYRHALVAAQHAAQHFQDEMVDLVINLGDIIDGKCAKSEDGEAAVDNVLNALSIYTHGKTLHTYGNHCLYNMDRPTIQTKLGIPFVTEPCGDLVGYYSHLVPDSNVRFLILDSYDVAIMQRCEKTSEKHARAVELLQEHNGENFSAGDENSATGLEGLQRRFVAFNGAVGHLQLEWLREQLERSRQRNEIVITVSHQPILPQSSDPSCLIWNYEEVLAILRDFKDVIVASFSGHDHRGGYQRDEVSGIHFRVFEAVLESPDPHKTYAIVDVYDDRLVVRGFGGCECAEYRFDHQHMPERQNDAR